jgi:hypothetical protein
MALPEKGEPSMDTSADLPNMLQKLLLLCGVLAPLLYLGTDWLAGRVLKGYSFAAQSMSELSAAGSPTRSLVVSLTLVASVLMIAFGVGIWQAADQTLFPRVVAGFVIGNAALGLIATIFFPTHFGVRPDFGSPGVIIMFFSVVCFVLAMVFGAAAFSGWLRILSIGIPASYILLAILRFATTASASAEEAAALIGAQERTMVYSFLVWVMALAIYLLLLSIRGMDSASGIGR